MGGPALDRAARDCRVRGGAGGPAAAEEAAGAQRRVPRPAPLSRSAAAVRQVRTDQDKSGCSRRIRTQPKSQGFLVGGWGHFRRRPTYSGSAAQCFTSYNFNIVSLFLTNFSSINSLIPNTTTIYYSSTLSIFVSILSDTRVSWTCSFLLFLTILHYICHISSQIILFFERISVSLL